MKISKFNDEVLYAQEDVVHIDAALIEQLKEDAKKNPRGRIRLCTHNDVQDSLHEMIIVHQKNSYVRPHKHLNKIETFTVIEGVVDVVLFDNDGKVLQRIEMGEYSSGKKFYQRLNAEVFHTLIIKSDVLVFHEVTNGPFHKGDIVFASWSPEAEDVSGCEEFLLRI